MIKTAGALQKPDKIKKLAGTNRVMLLPLRGSPALEDSNTATTRATTSRQDPKLLTRS